MLNRIILIICLTVFILSGCNISEENFDDSYKYGNKNLECLYYAEEDFIDISLKDTLYFDNVVGGIIPHHLLAKDLIHEFFMLTQSQEYDLIVLIGPDHISRDGKNIYTSLKNWQTPFGILDTEKDIVKELLNNKYVFENDNKLEIEHSISGIIPFTKKYFPENNTVCLTIPATLEMKDIDFLVEDIYRVIEDKKVLIIASVDFSHYLSYDEANLQDKITEEALLNRDYNKIFSFTNDNLDSPESIIILLKIMSKMQIENELILRNCNAYDIVPKDKECTTSYFTVMYYK